MSIKRFSGLGKTLGFWASRQINYPLVSPQVVQVSLTTRCNLRCRMCNIAGSQPAEEELSCVSIKRIIDQSSAWGIKEILFTGGEPFLREDIYELCAYSSDKGMRSIITTNGILIDKKACLRLSECGVGHVHFSFDGLEKTHDFFRGEGAFSASSRAFISLDEERKRGRRFSLGMAFTVMDRNAGEINEFVKLAKSLNADVVNFQPFCADNANFLKHEVKGGFWLSQEKVAILREQIYLLRKNPPGGPFIFEEPSLDLLPKYYSGTLSAKDWVCFGGFKTVFICYSEGVPLVYTCHGICGELDKCSLPQAWKSPAARGLRLHSRSCRNPCLQSCYSMAAAHSLTAIARKCLGRKAQ